MTHHNERPDQSSIYDYDNNVSQLAANDPLNHCGEQTRMLRHEIASCRAVPLITLPLQ